METPEETIGSHRLKLLRRQQSYAKRKALQTKDATQTVSTELGRKRQKKINAERNTEGSFRIPSESIHENVVSVPCDKHMPIRNEEGEVSGNSSPNITPPIIPGVAPRRRKSRCTPGSQRAFIPRDAFFDKNRINIETGSDEGTQDLLETCALKKVANCLHCDAIRFPYEPPSFCCADGRVLLNHISLPAALCELFTKNDRRSADFKRYIRSYNNNLAFSTFSARTDTDLLKNSKGVYTFKVQGQVHHYINDNLPTIKNTHGLYLYFFDPSLELKERLNISPRLDASIMSDLMNILSVNPYRLFLQQLKDFPSLYEHTIVLYKNPSSKEKVYDLPSSEEVAAIIPTTTSEDFSSRCHIQIYTKESVPHRIYHSYACYDSLQYPLLFPKGQGGWHKDIDLLPSRHTTTNKCTDSLAILPEVINNARDLIAHEERVAEKTHKIRSLVTCRQYYCYRFQIRDFDSSMLLHAGRLFQKFVVDMYIKIETSRLDYLRDNQNSLRVESLTGVLDSISMGLSTGGQVGKRIFLPASFTGGPRDLRRRYLDAMALVQKYGKPDFFITMTCNPNWPEIKEHLIIGELAQDRPDLIVRVFKAKLQSLQDELMKDHIFGKVQVMVYSVEFQKRGLPHAHILLIMKTDFKPLNPDAYDRFISAEIPCPVKFPLLNSMVRKHMMHGPCGRLNESNVCMRKGQCKNRFPKDFTENTVHNNNSYPHYRRRENKRVVPVRGHDLDNRWVVPYNPYLLAKYDCHINVEICSSVKLVKYIYKYIYKGPDKITFSIVTAEETDEIRDYQDARWITPPEAMWRIYSLKLSEMHPSVYALQLHLPNNYPITFTKDTDLNDLAANINFSKTMLTQFFHTNRINDKAKKLNLLYKEFPEHFVWHGHQRIWTARKKGQVIGRVVAVNPVEGEKYFLRLLLNHVRSPTSFDDLYTYNGNTSQSFRDSCLARGLLNSDAEIEDSLHEATAYQMPSSFRHFFCTVLVYCNPDNPRLLWDRFEPQLSEDFVRQRNLDQQEKIEIRHRVIEQLAVFIESMGKTVEQLNFLPPEFFNVDRTNNTREINFEKNLSVSEDDLMSVVKLNTCQKKAYDQILASCYSDNNKIFFIDGPGGTGKTFLYKALLATIRSQGLIAIATATSGVAASILPGGRTAHSRFKLPLKIDETKTVGLSKQSSTACLIRDAKLIIWDEAPMAKRSSIEIFEVMLRDIADFTKAFGGKTVVFGGDFRQVLPVIRRGSIQDQINSCFIHSPLWENITKIQLHENMRAIEDPFFVDFLLKIGNGLQPEDEFRNVKLPPCILIPYIDRETSLDSLISFVYPNLNDFEVDSHRVMNRCLLGPTNDCIDDINNYLINKFPGQPKTYISRDIAVDQRNQGDYEDFLNSLSPSGLPPHTLTLKLNCPVILLRNLNPTQGFCNGTRLVCKELKDHTILAEIGSGPYKGKRIILNKIPLESSEEELNGIPFRRYQLPIRLCFAITINKSQGQTLDSVGLYLREPVFSHGQLYVALSRAKSFSDVRVLIVPPTFQDKVHQDVTRNIVIQEVLSTPDMDGFTGIYIFLLCLYKPEKMKKICYISEIDQNTQDWTSIVTVNGKSNPHRSPSGHQIQKLLLRDDKGGEVEGVIWNHNIEALKDKVQLFRKYEITNAAVSEILPKYRHYSNGLTIQWTLDSETDIKLCNQDEIKVLSSPLKKASISEMLAFKKESAVTDLLAVVIGSENPRYVGLKKDFLVQELTVVTEELMPIKFSLWNSFANEQGSDLLQILHERPIVLCKRLKVGFFRGVTLQTTISSTVLVQPSTSEAMEFRAWAMKHADEIAALARQKNEASLESELPVQRIKEHIPVAELKEDTTGWTNGQISMADSNQPCYYKACQKCHTKTQKEIGDEYFCTRCQNDQICVPWCLVNVEFSDLSATITATTFGKTAEMIMGKKATELATMTPMELQNHLLDMAMDYDRKSTYTLMSAKRGTGQGATIKYTIQQVYKEKTNTAEDNANTTTQIPSFITPKEEEGSSSTSKKQQQKVGRKKRKTKVRLDTIFEQESQSQSAEKKVDQFSLKASAARGRTRESKLFAEINSLPDSLDSIPKYTSRKRSKK